MNDEEFKKQFISGKLELRTVDALADALTVAHDQCKDERGLPCYGKLSKFEALQIAERLIDAGLFGE